MPARLYIEGSRHPRPPSHRTLYCDGSHGPQWREGVDLELSHWVPNVTPAIYKDDTSTGVALRYIDAGAPGGYDLVVNDHVDTDGLLASLVLLHAAQALPHRRLLLQTAAMGDFGAWGEPAAQRLFQQLAIERVRLQALDTDPLDLALALHQRALAALAEHETLIGTLADPGLQALQRAVDRIHGGQIARRQLAERLVHYVVPPELAPPGLDLTPDQPRLDRPLHAQAVLPPAARAVHDAQRLQIVSIARGPGRWTHDLCWPSYAWADTVTLWRPPGLLATGAENDYRFEMPLLQQAAAELNRLESAAGRWQVAQALGVFKALPGRHFPVVLSFMDHEHVAASALPPDTVARVLLPALA
jgi:hypothetical protein